MSKSPEALKFKEINLINATRNTLYIIKLLKNYKRYWDTSRTGIEGEVLNPFFI